MLNNKKTRRKEIASKYLAGEKIKNICLEYGLSDETIARDLKIEGIKLRGAKRYSFDDTVFQEIDSHEKAYWLGFIFAEGNIYKDTLAIKLGQEDKNHLNEYVKFMKSDNPIEKRRNKKSYSYCVRIYSKKICKDLNRLGVFPNKSKGIVIPEIKEKFMNSFLLGFFDGDGWLSVSKNNSWNVGFCSCSERFILQIREYFKTANIGTESIGSLFCREYKENKKWNKLYTLIFSGNLSCFSVLKFLYGNLSDIGPLSRKIEKFHNFEILMKKREEMILANGSCYGYKK